LKKINLLNKEIHFVRASNDKYGGAENYLSRLSVALKEINTPHKIIRSKLPKFLPSWLRVILFNFQVSLFKKNKFYFSLERITCPDVYRAGDGVHRIYLRSEKKSRFNPLHPIYLFLEKKCFQNAKCIIANSLMVKNQIIDCYDINPNKIRVVYNGIKPKKNDYQGSFDRLSKEYLIKQDQIIFLYVGSGFKRKGVKQFLQIISKLDKENITAFIVGKEKNFNYYVNLAKDLGIKDKVIFTGPREDVSDFYNVSDFFILPTHYEPFSNVVIEALQSKNVVITTKQNGASEILNKQFIMSTPDDFSIVLTINKLLDDKIECEKIKNDNKVLSKKFSIEKNVNETLKVINEIIN